MRLLGAFGATFALMILCVFLDLATGTPVPGLIVVLATAVWATVDSYQLELHKYSGGIDHPILVFFAVGCLWIIFFPLYLVTRSPRIDGELKLKKKYRNDVATAVDATGER